jgi:hypothetical protein
MAKGDVIKVHQFDEGKNVAVFEPILDPTRPGYYITDAKNNVLVRPVGGVKPGSLGKIDGDGIKVPAGAIGIKNQLGLGNDSIMIYPVFFDEYQKVAWLSADSFRIVEGGSF